MKYKCSTLSLALSLVFVFLFACNQPKSEKAVVESQAQRGLQDTVAEDVTDEPDNMESDNDENMYYANNINGVWGAKKFVPTAAELEFLKTPQGGNYTNKRINLKNLDCRYIMYLNKDSTDVRVFFATYKNDEMTYVKQIAQRKGDNPYTFFFDVDARILRISDPKNNKPLDFYRLTDEGRLESVKVPLVYNIYDHKAYDTYIKPDSYVSVLNFEHSYNIEVCTIKSYNKEENASYLNPSCKIASGYAFEGQKPFSVITDKIRIDTNQPQYEKLMDLIKLRTDGDAVTSFGYSDPEIYEIEHNKTKYQLYSVTSSFRHGTYVWVYATVNNDMERPYFLYAYPGNIEINQPFVVGNDLYIYLYYEWDTAFGESHETRFSLIHLSPQICCDLFNLYE